MKTDKRFENLANAIILQAVSDWRECRKDDNGEYRHPRDTKVSREEIKTFFRSEWFTCLSQADPEFIIDFLEREEKRS